MLDDYETTRRQKSGWSFVSLALSEGVELFVPWDGHHGQGVVVVLPGVGAPRL